MKRLLRRKKRHCDEDRREGCTRTLHLDTAFENKGFNDMDRFDTGDVLNHSKGVYSVAHWGKNAGGTEGHIRMYGKKMDFYNYTEHGSLQSSGESDKKATEEKIQVVVNERSIIERNCREEELLIETEVGRKRDDLEDRGKKHRNDKKMKEGRSHIRSKANYYSKDIYENVSKENSTYRWKVKEHSVKFSTATDRHFGAKIKRASRNETSHSRTTAEYWSQDIAEDIANGNSKYRWKARETSVKFSTAPDRNFGAIVNRAAGESKKGKALKNNSERKDSKSYLQKIGGKMDRCISLPNVDTLTKIMSFASYNANFDDTSSLSDFGNEGVPMGNTGIISTVGNSADKHIEYHNEDEIRSDVASMDLQHSRKRDVERTREASSGSIQTCARIEECERTLTKGVQIHHRKQQTAGGEKANTGAEMNKNGFDQSKQNNCISECDSHGNDSNELRSEGSVTSSESATYNNNDTIHYSNRPFHTRKKPMQLNDVSRAGVGGEEIVCGCISQYSEAPANMEKMPCTCQQKSESESTYKIDEKQSGITNQTKSGMNNNSSGKQRLVGRPANTLDNCEHTAVQIHHVENRLYSAHQSSSESGGIAFDTGNISSNGLNVTWSLIPSTVQYTEARDVRLGDIDPEAVRSIIDVSTSEVTTTELVDEVEDRPSTVESTAKRRVNMQEIELNLGDRRVSFQELEKGRDSVETALGKRPALRQANTLDRLSGLLRELNHKRKRVLPSRHTKRTSCVANNETRSSEMGIEMVDLAGKSTKIGTDEAINYMKETKIDIEDGDVPLVSTFILEGAKEAAEQLSSDNERLKREMLHEKSRLASLLQTTALSYRKKYTIILVLCAIEADMPEEFFDYMHKSRMLKALLAEQLDEGRELILHNMYSPRTKPSDGEDNI